MRYCISNHTSMIGLTRRLIVRVPIDPPYNSNTVVVEEYDVNCINIREVASKEGQYERWWLYDVLVVYGDITSPAMLVDVSELNRQTVSTVNALPCFQSRIAEAINAFLKAEIERDLRAIKNILDC